MKTEQRYEIIDNVKGISKLQDNSIDLTVTSPPYDNLRTYNGFSFNFEALAKELFRVTKNGGVVVWVVGDETKNGNESCTSFRQVLYFKEIGFNLNDTMIYKKINGAIGSKYTYLQEFEYMFVLSKGYPKTVNFLRDRKNVRSGNETTPKSKSNRTGELYKRTPICLDEYGRRKNIWEYPVGGIQETSIRHPAVFPEQLAKDHILSWSNEGDTVLDPFLGSATTLKICMETNRNGIGFEINEGYENIIIERLKLNHQKLDAFDTSAEPK